MDENYDEQYEAITTEKNKNIRLKTKPLLINKYKKHITDKQLKYVLSNLQVKSGVTKLK